MNENLKDKIKKFQIELPSWAFGNSGTRFKVFSQAGVPRNVFEKIEDVSEVNRLTGCTPSVALHIPWDYVDDWDSLNLHAKNYNVSIGTINTNTFQDEDYKFGSVTNYDITIRQKADLHISDCIKIMRKTNSKELKLWFADGLNYPGQANFIDRQNFLLNSLKRCHDLLKDDEKMFLEYKFFEPAFYSTDVPDWGTAFAHTLELGQKALVCVDLGHHAQATNIEMIVAFLLWKNKLGAFDFNSRFYADDDLIVGASDPFQLFRIMHEVNINGGLDKNVKFMLDQSHNIEDKIPAIIRSVTNVQESLAKALLVDAQSLNKAQENGDVLLANEILMDAYKSDVRPLLAEIRTEMGLNPDPNAAYKSSLHAEKIKNIRVGGTPASWN